MMVCENDSSPIVLPSTSTTTKPPSPPPTPPPATSFSRPNDACFSCKRLGHWSRDCPNKIPKKSLPSSPGSACEDDSSPMILPSTSTTTKPPSPQPTPPPATSFSRPNDACFNCKLLGHWSRDCPNKTPKKSQPSSPGSATPPFSSMDLPLIRCPCGKGICVIRSSTKKNPGRRFFGCPGGRGSGCDFFIWCDEVTAKMCPCGAGMCSLNRESSGPDRCRWYYACRIKKNHGACRFFQWVDTHVMTIMNRYVDKNKGVFSPESLNTGQQAIYTIANNLGKEKNLNSKRELNTEVVENFANPENEIIMAVDSRTNAVIERDLGMINALDLGMQQPESWDPLITNVCQVSHPIPLYEIFCQWEKFSWRISIEDAIYQLLHLHFHGWLGRLVFPPSQGLKDPPTMHFFCCIFPSFVSITIPDAMDMSYIEDSNLLPQNPSCLEPDVLLTTIVEDDQSLSTICWEPSRLKNPSYTAENNDTSMSILKKFGQGLLDILQSMNPRDHENMLEVAEATFNFLGSLSIDYESFSVGVKDYIQCMSRLTGIEKSMRKDVSCEEVVDLYNCEKVQFDNVSLLYDEVVASYEASNNHLKSLREEILQVRIKLVQLKKQLSSYEIETLELQTHVFEVSKDISESKRSMEATSLQMEKALDLKQQKEIIVDAAKVALENARFHLQV